MPRTSPAAVAAIVKTAAAIVGEDLSGLGPFIELANMAITRFCGSANYDITTLEQFERLYAAHLYACRDKTIGRTAQAADGISDTFGLKLGMGLEGSIYGQQLKVLCPEIAAADARANSKTPKPGVAWLGTDNRYGFGFGGFP